MEDLPWRNTTHAWGRLSRRLHWLLAAGLIAMLVMGLWMVRLDYYDPLYHQLPRWHRTLGVALAPFLLLRLGLHLAWPRPALPGRAWERRLAVGVHWLLVILPLGLVASGYLLSTAGGHPLELAWGWNLPGPDLGIERLEDRAGLVHQSLAWSLIGLLGLHLAGAFKHQLIDHRSLFDRIGWR